MLGGGHNTVHAYPCFLIIIASPSMRGSSNQAGSMWLGSAWTSQPTRQGGKCQSMGPRQRDTRHYSCKCSLRSMHHSKPPCRAHTLRHIFDLENTSVVTQPVALISNQPLRRRPVKVPYQAVDPPSRSASVPSELAGPVVLLHPRAHRSQLLRRPQRPVGVPQERAGEEHGVGLALCNDGLGLRCRRWRRGGVQRSRWE